MYDVFICYVRTYIDQVTPLHDALEVALRNLYQRGTQVFQDTSDLQVGNKWAREVDTALDQARVMVVVVVPTILESPQCRREMLQFIRTPGKHLVPLICERDPHLSDLAASVGDHPEGSEAHEIAVCAAALREWQEFDFSQAVYQNPNESSYKIAIAELARMIRTKLKHEDRVAAADAAAPAGRPEERAEGAPADMRADPAPDRSEGPAETRGNRPQASDAVPERTPRRPARTAILAGIAAVIIALGVAAWTLIAPQPEVRQSISKAQASSMFDRIMTDAARQAGAEGVSFDAESGTLRIASPPTGTARARIDLQPAMDPLLRAGFAPGFFQQDSGGEACLSIRGEPLVLESTQLDNGDFVAVRIGIFPREDRPNQKICLNAASVWRLVEAQSAVVDRGAILAQPRDDAPALRSLRSGQRIQGPFWTSNEVPGWIRMDYRGEYGFFRRDLVRVLE